MRLGRVAVNSAGIIIFFLTRMVIALELTVNSESEQLEL